MAKNYSQNGEYELIKLQINLPDGNSLDLKNAFMEINVYETLSLSNMSGNVVFLDSEGVYTKFALGNGEEIQIEWKTAGSNNNIRYKGTIFKAEPPGRISEHASGIILHFVSTEYIKSLQAAVQEPYNEEISKIIDKNFKKIKNEKSIELIKSKGIFNIIGTGQKPIDFINQISRYAVSSNNEYAYLFYEDNQQFNFKPLQNLYKQEPETQYYYKNSGVFSDVKKKEEESFNAIQEYEFIEVPNLIDLTEVGLLGATTQNFNILQKNISTQTYKEDESFDKSKSLGRFPQLSNFLYNSKSRLGYDEITISYKETENIKHRFQNYMEIFKHEKFAANIVVFGDTANRVGMVIKCDMPVWNTDAHRDSTEMFSGDCLVFELKHTLKKTGYTQVMKIVKDSFEKGGLYGSE